ncbi:MAG TPA: type II toxin-antitoxin system Phd/YefM family antitoxin [Bryobacteraceae bacterium]|nr:type II toxin-antitoxin system Phd/YefM family antitoxin [Bryobacteraceae bacterium]
MDETTWTVAQAKAKLSEVITQAELKGPQTITRNGRTAVVMVSYEEWERKTKRVGNLAEFFAASPLRGADVTLERLPEQPHEIEL